MAEKEKKPTVNGQLTAAREEHQRACDAYEKLKNHSRSVLTEAERKTHTKALQEALRIKRTAAEKARRASMNLPTAVNEPVKPAARMT